MNSITRNVAAVCLIASAPLAGHAQVALVEGIKSKTAGVELMDYLPVGKEIRLGKQDTLALGYLKSCWHEIITGGVVTVGNEQSDVRSGKVERRKLDCDGGKLMLTAQQASQSAGMVVRDLKPRPQTTLEPQVTIFGVSPVIELKGGGALLVERLDEPGERHEIAISAPHLAHNAFYDFARSGTPLTPGGIYRASAGTRQVIFKVDATAKPGASPIISRLLRIQSGT